MHTHEGAKHHLHNTCTVAAYVCMSHLVYKLHLTLLVFFLNKKCDLYSNKYGKVFINHSSYEVTDAMFINCKHNMWT